MSDLPKIFGNDPVKLLAEEASPAMIHRWIDYLYEAKYELNETLTIKMYTIAAITEYIETYPLNNEYMRKFLSAAELGTTRMQEMLEQMQLTKL